MKKSLLVLSPILLFGETINLETFTVASEKENEVGTKEAIQISQKPDLSEILSQNIPQINLSRTSGIGNDIILRGQQRDNIAVVIDDSTIYGACPNRMDPAIMHISTSSVEDVEIREGVFDITQYGSLAGTVHVKSREPDGNGESSVSVNVNSVGAERTAIELELGDEVFAGHIGYSYETGKQYEDGNGNDFAEQIIELTKSGTAKQQTVQYKDPDLDAYTRQNWFGNFVYHLDDQQKIQFRYFGDRADDVLYPIFGMDALEDETHFFNFKYEAFELGDFSNKFKTNVFYSKVYHDMGNEFRLSSNNMIGNHRVESIAKGLKIENMVGGKFLSSTLGFDFMEKTWDGNFYVNDIFSYTMIPDVKTDDVAFYGDTKWSDEVFEITFGTRLDFVNIEAGSLDTINPYAIKTGVYANKEKNDYFGFGANLFSRYFVGDETSIFLGFGQSTRFPNAKELYMNKIAKTTDGTPFFAIKGNPDLKETKNREIDLGFDSSSFNSKISGKVFYSYLIDFIYAYNNGTGLGFTNLDAKVWGFDLSASKELFKNLNGKVGFAYQRGEKVDAIDGQTDKDLAEIPPFKFLGNLEYKIPREYSVRLETVLGGEPEIDSDNGEKEISNYFVANLKGSYDFSQNLVANFGVDNIFNEVYALNNSYIGRGVNSTTPDEIFILNEMGRNYFFTLTYKY
jgi:iron complex outermembrane receptor protein